MLLLHQTFFSRSYTRWCRVGLERCGERRLARRKSPILTAQTTRPLDFFFGKKGVRINEKLKNPRRATCGTDSPSRSKSRALSITPLHHPKKDGSMTDFQHTQPDPHGSHRKMLHVLLTHLPTRCALTFFPRSRRASSQTPALLGFFSTCNLF